MQAELTEQPNDDNQTNSQAKLSRLLIILLKGVLYEDAKSQDWAQLILLQSRVRDYVNILGLELILDEAEGYAFLRTRQSEEDKAGSKSDDIPRLITRRQLSFPVSLLLALLRKKLAEFDASGGETRLVLSRDNIVELMQLFIPDSSNEAKRVDQTERHINKVVELGFLRKLKPVNSKPRPEYEVRRIIKAFVDAQWLAEFDAKLESYRQQLTTMENEGE